MRSDAADFAERARRMALSWWEDAQTGVDPPADGLRIDVDPALHARLR
jgi:hypothetical protein